MTSFFVPGVPVPKGSAKSFYNKKAQKIVTMQDNRERQRPWASLISFYAQEAGCRPVPGPISLALYFTMPRPKHHYGTGKNSTALKASAPNYHTGTPDLDKLLRSVLDALTGVVWYDDSQVCLIAESWKRYGENPGVMVEIMEIEDEFIRKSDEKIIQERGYKH